MSMIALVTGKLLKAPTTKTGKTGDPYTLATLRAATDDGDVLVNVIAFGQAGGAATDADSRVEAMQ